MFRKPILLLLSVILASSCGRQLWSHRSFFLDHHARYTGLLLGVLLFAVLWMMRKRWPLLQNWLTYYGTKIHEDAHEKMALLSGRRLFGYSIQPDGSGHIIYEASGDAPLITLAPYFFSYTSLSLLGLRWLVLPSGLAYFDALIGFLLAFHTYAFLTQTRTYQTDLQKMGLHYAIVFIGLMHLILYGFYIWVISGLPILSYVKPF